ncbi:MAG: hypothetical protein WCS03_11705 [Bacteroidota bacterium]
MEVSDLIFADYAATNDRGKFTLVGAGFSEISTLKVPCVHPLMFLFMRVKVMKQDMGKNRVEIRLTGEKGPIFKADGELIVSPDHKEEQHIPFSFQLVNLKFDHPGDYSLEVRLNGNLKQSQTLKIKLIQPQSNIQ